MIKYKKQDSGFREGRTRVTIISPPVYSPRHLNRHINKTKNTDSHRGENESYNNIHLLSCVFSPTLNKSESKQQTTYYPERGEPPHLYYISSPVKPPRHESTLHHIYHKALLQCNAHHHKNANSTKMIKMLQMQKVKK